MRQRGRIYGSEYSFIRLMGALLLLVAYSSGPEARADVFAGYDSFCGLPVVVGPDSQTATARTDPSGQRFIHIDPGAMNNWSMSRMFTLAHECAHHLLGHTSQLGQMQRYRGGPAPQELEADCWAAQKLASVGYTSDITRTILQYANQGHFSGGGYPSGYQRMQNIKNCVGGGGGRNCRRVTHQCSHAAHGNGDRVPCQHVGMAHAFDAVPCQHMCNSPYGPRQCHPYGDRAPCQHRTRQHQFDVVACRHTAHPGGHSERVCR